MTISSLICEFDPFHNGHKHLLDSMRKSGADCIVACMSGNFTQRGEPAAFDKHTRTKAAVLGGADLVLELPVTFACSSAERFAFGGVSIIEALGCAESIFFGSECGDTAMLKTAAEALVSPDFDPLLKEKLRTGITYASARERTVRELCGDESADLLRSPNNILGIEYMKALSALKSRVRPCTIKRTGAEHNSASYENGYASASLLRRLVHSGKSIEGLVPEAVLPVFQERNTSQVSRPELLERALLCRLRTMSLHELSLLPDVSEGLENRLYSAVRTQTSAEGILTAVKTKRYTMSRLRRILTYALLGITEADMPKSPPYIRVLGFNETGRLALAEIKKRASLPMITKASEVQRLDTAAKTAFALESRCDDIYSLSCPEISPCGTNQTRQIVIV